MAIQDMVVNFVVKPTRSVFSITWKLCLFQALVYHYVGSVGQLSHKRKFVIELALAVKKRTYGTDRYEIHTNTFYLFIPW